jgi:hypothetical protein
VIRWLTNGAKPANGQGNGQGNGPTSFEGRWFTSFGPMTLRQESGDRLKGTYGRDGTENTIEGTVSGSSFSFGYEEVRERGRGWFRLKRHGHFSGEYQAEGAPAALPWRGWRDFDGLWDTSLGRLRLFQEADRVHGALEADAAASLLGQIEQGRLAFAIEGPRGAGRGTFELDSLGATLSGEWIGGGQAAQPIGGGRVLGRPGLTWLVVLEAHWQRSLDDSEFAFGHMLHELFARLPRAQVRHRFYHDEASLVHWCRQLLFLPEPVVLVITGHGEAEGLSINGRIADMRKIVDSLHYADSLQLLHFSSCLVGQDVGRALSAAPFPASGYTTRVDWAESALAEFIYLDMILEKGLPPARAAEQLVRLVRFAGDDEIEGSPYRPAGFRFFDPAQGPPPAGEVTA